MSSGVGTGDALSQPQTPSGLKPQRSLSAHKFASWQWGLFRAADWGSGQTHVRLIRGPRLRGLLGQTLLTAHGGSLGGRQPLLTARPLPFHGPKQTEAKGNGARLDWPPGKPARAEKEGLRSNDATCLSQVPREAPPSQDDDRGRNLPAVLGRVGQGALSHAFLSAQQSSLRKLPLNPITALLTEDSARR